jgi:hypothetical protein
MQAIIREKVEKRAALIITTNKISIRFTGAQESLTARINESR